jgi:hypothetical protein
LKKYQLVPVEERPFMAARRTHYRVEQARGSSATKGASKDPDDLYPDDLSCTHAVSEHSLNAHQKAK